ncbi:hypothetical protein [Roseateles asaccharophilus]|uniref:Uncharacterized protein n=1 Tax=Roseateles asaccharophilus TaxID=582607 RepID=A0ABU2A6R2_9BURK|nr:hypothetical protein [Roseateles asaccharophilus]MDR7332690.1 hypothetical protein [Roseateles asaccharophilus]
MPSFSPAQFRRIVWASAAYDVVVTAPFATPWTFAIAFGQLSVVNQALGGQPLPAFEPMHQLFALLMASVVMVWSWLRLRTPTAALGRHDAVTRLLFSTWMFWTWLQTGAPVMLLFLLPEISWAVAQAWPVKLSAPATAALRPSAA